MENEKDQNFFEWIWGGVAIGNLSGVEWIALILGCLSILTFLLWVALIPSSDGRFRTGNKDNAVTPGCTLPIAAIIMGIASFFIDEDMFFGPIFIFIKSFFS